MAGVRRVIRAMKSLVWLVMGLGFGLAGGVRGAEEGDSGDARWSPPFFAFQNGVGPGSLEERASKLAGLGYDGMGSAREQDAVAGLIPFREAGLEIFSIYATTRLTAEGPVHGRGLEEAIAQLKGKRSQVVIELALMGKPENAHEAAVAAVREVAGWAAASGLKVVIYPHSGFYIETIGGAVALAEAVDLKNVGVMFNLCHFLRCEPGADLDAELEKARPYLWRVSVNGADREGTDWKTLIRPLDEGSYDVVELLKRLEAMGYEGPVGLQGFGVKGDPQENLKRSMAAWRELMGRVNAR